MMFKRGRITSYGNELPQPAGPGSGTIENLAVTAIATDANATLTVADISGSAVQFTGFTAGRNITTPTAAAIIAAATDMDIGDSFSLYISITTAFAGTYVAGAGVTLAGRATTPASSFSVVTVKKLSATTVEWRVL
jgi:hypothetical protein